MFFYVANATITQNLGKKLFITYITGMYIEITA